MLTIYFARMCVAKLISEHETPSQRLKPLKEYERYENVLLGSRLNFYGILDVKRSVDG